MPASSAVPLPAGLQDGLQELAQAAVAAARVRDHEGLRAHLEGRVGGSGGEADLGRSRARSFTSSPM